MLVRPVEPLTSEDIRASARRAGVSESSVWQGLAGKLSPMTLLVTGLEAGVARRLASLGRRPESEAAGALVITAGGDGAVVSGSRWEIFTLATRLAGQDDDEALVALATALSGALARLDRRPEDMQLGATRWAFEGTTRIMGVLNVTPDSFSDGGRYADTEVAVAHGLSMAGAGADIIDVGGESTRPGAPAVSTDEECRRVVPVVERLASEGVLVSIDTTKAEVAREALAAGAVMVNDVSGLAREPALAGVVSEAGAALVLMHMRGTPADMQAHTGYTDLVGEVLGGLAASLQAAREAGVSRGQLMIDPGIGFAKTATQSLTLLRRLGSFRSLGHPILVGASRKSFIGHTTGAGVGARLPGSLAAAVLAATRGADLVRVHDVAETRQAVTLADAVDGARDEGEGFEAGSAWWKPEDQRVG